VFVVYSKYIHVFPDAYSARESPYKDVHVSFKSMENIFLLENVQSTLVFGGGSWGEVNNVSFSLHWTTCHEGRGTVPYVCDCVRMSSNQK
jgi:hypothetical protein